MVDQRVVYVCIALVAVWYFYPRDTIPTDFHELLKDVPAREDLTEHTKEFNKPEVIKITDGIHMAIGYALANSIMLDAPDGLIIVDVTESMEAARRVLEAFRKLTDRPIKAVIYTHNHADHVYGAEAFIEDPDNLPEFWSHHTTLAMLRRVATVSLLTYKRAMRQFGVLLPSHINSGIGIRLTYGKNATTGLVYPTRFLEEDQAQVNIAGMPLTLLHIPGETSDQIGVWIPEKKALLCADDFYKAFPNLYAIRGTPSRDFREWISSLDIMRKLRPHHLIPSHTRPLEGEDYIYQMLTEYRDAIQLIHDQTVRYMNMGLLPDEIVEKIALPPNLLDNPYLKEFYGTVGWSVKGVFNNYMGWFSGDPVELWPLQNKDKAQKMVALGGGIGSMVSAADTALYNNDLQWALELATHVLRVRPDHEKAKQIRFLSLKNLAAKQISANGRNYYLTCALEDLGLVNKPSDEARQNNLNKWPLWQIFEVMTTRFKPEECQDVNKIVLFDFEDVNEHIGFYIRNSITELFRGKPEQEADVTVHVKSKIWREIAGKTRSPFKAYLDGHIVVDGGILSFRSIMGCFDSD